MEACDKGVRQRNQKKNNVRETSTPTEITREEEDDEKKGPGRKETKRQHNASMNYRTFASPEHEKPWRHYYDDRCPTLSPNNKYVYVPYHPCLSAYWFDSLSSP